MNVELEQLRTIATGTVKILKENGGIYTAELIQSYEDLPSVRLSEYTDKDYYFKVTEYECALTS